MEYRIEVTLLNMDGDTELLPSALKWIGPLPRTGDVISLSQSPNGTIGGEIMGLTHRVHNFSYDGYVEIVVDIGYGKLPRQG